MSLSTAEKLILFSERPFSLQDFFLRNPVDGFIYEGQDVSLAANYVAGGRSDLIVQWAESTGVTPITVTETACGLRLDERFTGIRGPELVVNGGFAGDLSGWGVAGAWAYSGGAAVKSGGSTATLNQDILTIGKTYEISVDVTAVSGSVLVYAGAGINIALGTVGTHTFRLLCSGDTNLYVQCLTTHTGAVDNISVKEVPGNHALQATSAARPVVSQRYNWLTKTRGQYADAAWTKADTTPTEGQTAHDGTATATLMTEGVAGTGIVQSGSVTTSSPTNVARIEVKRGNTDWIRLRLLANGGVDGGAYWVNLATGAAGSRSVVSAGSGLNHTVTPLANGWHEVRFTSTAAGATTALISVCSASADASVTRVNNATYFIRDPDIRTADDAAKSIPAYQYVNTATDMATDGFPAYEKFDGTDDSRTSATGGGSTTGFFWCGVVTVLGGAATNRLLFDDRGASFITGFVVAITSGNVAYLGVGNGATQIGATGDAVAVGSSIVLTAWYEGGIGYIQVNNAAPVASAAVTASAGLASFTEGKINSVVATNFHNGRLYGRVYCKNYSPSANLRERIKRELAKKAGCLHLLNS